MKKSPNRSRFYRVFYTLVRSLVCFFIILAMAGMSIQQTSDITTTVFAVDQSDSVKQAKQKIQKFLSEAEQKKGSKDWTGIVCFGENAVVENPPDKNTVLTKSFLSYVDPEGSHLDRALAVSAGAISSDTRKRIVLLSDGCETNGDVLKQVEMLRSQGIRIDVFPLELEEQEEVQLSKLELAEYIHTNTEYDLALTLDSNVDTDVNVKLYKGNSLIGNEDVSVTSGENKIVFGDKTEKGGSVLYRAEITPKKDTITRNNKAYAYTYIADVPQILLVEKDGSGSQWNVLMEQTKASVQTVSPEGAPNGLDKLGLYDGVILADVSAEDLSDEFLTILKSYVKELGGGLLVTGGEHAYALGSYQNTVLEEILPVDMNLRSEGEDPSLGMIMVIDRSGSMEGSQYGVSKLELAKEAALRSLESFQPNDQLGIIAFDSQPNWAVEFQGIDQGKEAIKKGIGTIQCGGGTSILPALQEAEQVLKKTNSKQKHILLLTDGQAEQKGYQGLMDEMKQNGITLSTIAVGSDADNKLLQKLAKQGSGRYYFTNEFTDLPEIFAKETILAGKDYIKNRTFYPSVQNNSPILDGIEQITELDGYIGTTSKGRAEVLLKSDIEEPILATWQFGLGRTAAWTSDMNGKWTAKWLQSAEGSTILRNTLSWVMKKQADVDVKVRGEREGEGSKLTVTMPYDKEVTEMDAIVISADGNQTKTKLSMNAPGIYSGKLDKTKEGAYMVQLQKKHKDGTIEMVQSGFHLSYPKEYEYRRNGENILRLIAEKSGGRVLKTGDEVFAQEAQETTTQKDFSVFFMLLAFLLFLFDIALHRFPVLFQKINEIFQKLQELFQKEKNNKKEFRPLETKKQKSVETITSKKQQKKESFTEENNSGNTSTANKLLKAKRKRNQ